MIETFCQLMYSPSLKSAKGGAYFKAIHELGHPVWPWSFDAPPASDEALRDACDRGERMILDLGDEEWIVSADWSTGAMNLTGDLPEGAEHEAAVARVLSVMDTACRVLRPRFAWGDLDQDYPPVLAKSILDLRVPWLFWLNYYGSEYLREYGENFFRLAPFEQTADLGGCVRCLTSLHPGRASGQGLDALKQYFAKRWPEVDVYAR